MINIPEEINLEGYTLILPSIAVGNVGQLCIDLLISNLKLPKIGSLWSSTFLPICGLDPYDPNSINLCTEADFYVGVNSKIILLQLRSRCTGNLPKFFNVLTQFIQEKKFNKIVILTSSHDYARYNRSDSNLRFFASEDILSSNQQFFDTVCWTNHGKDNQVESESREKYKIVGGGFANHLFDHLVANNVPCIVLFRYCSEGDNVPDTLELFNGLNQWLKLLETNTDDNMKINYPMSWKHLFGNPPSPKIY